MKRVHLKLLAMKAATAGQDYLNDCLRAGKIAGDFLLLTDRSYLALWKRYTPQSILEAIMAARQEVCQRCPDFWRERMACMKCHSGPDMFWPWENMIDCPARRWPPRNSFFGRPGVRPQAAKNRRIKCKTSN